MTEQSRTTQSAGNCLILRCGGLILLFIAALLFGACSGGGSQEKQAAAPEETTEETAEETTEEPTRKKTQEKQEQRPVQAAQKSEKTTQPKPSTPEERIRANLKEAHMIGIADKLKGIQVYPDPGNGCTRVRIDYQAKVPSSIEYEMGRVYRAVYADNQLSQQVCDVEVNAYGTTNDKFGQTHEELYYSTHLTGPQANRVNWNENANVNFPEVWTLNYKHPAVEQAEAKEALDTAIDCAVDEGIFDNWFCPS